MDLSTKWLGLDLKNPLVISACPMTKDINLVKTMEEQGASAVVMPSLFEEEITYDQNELDHFLGTTTDIFSEASDYFPEPSNYENVGAEEYLSTIKKLKEAVSIPVVGSLNGYTKGGWTKYAKKIEEAGADALELNLYNVQTDLDKTPEEIENEYCEVIKLINNEITIPVTVKISPFFTSIPHFSKKIIESGAEGVTLFNRFLEPDFDLETYEVHPKIELSSPYEMRLSLHWTAILYQRLNLSIAATRGAKTSDDIAKYIMAGADVVMIASVLYQNGINSISKILNDLKVWMEEKEYNSISEMKGAMSYTKVANPSVYERANYMKMLRSNL